MSNLGVEVIKKMNDAAHILMIVFIGVVIILVNIWRASIKRR